MADIYPVYFVEEWMEADLALTRRGRRREPEAATAAAAARGRLERDGLDMAATDVARCLALGPDGTRLEGCVKVYLPVGGHWRLVFAPVTIPSREVYMCLAFGRGHPLEDEGPSVYEIADRRLRQPR